MVSVIQYTLIMGKKLSRKRDEIRKKNFPGVPIDVMIIPDDIKPEAVVSNFDLTFCQIWYNGTTVKATDWDDVREKKGRLREGYVNALVEHFNPFIRKRLLKYCKRGYRISYDIPGDVQISCQSASKTVISPEDWVVNLLWNTMVRTRMSPFDYKEGLSPVSKKRSDKVKNLRIKAYQKFVSALGQIQWILENPLKEHTIKELNEIVKRQKDHKFSSTTEYYKVLLKKY